jgi:hypothetical protein
VRHCTSDLHTLRCAAEGIVEKLALVEKQLADLREKFAALSRCDSSDPWPQDQVEEVFATLFARLFTLTTQVPRDPLIAQVLNTVGLDAVGTHMRATQTVLTPRLLGRDSLLNERAPQQLVLPFSTSAVPMTSPSESASHSSQRVTVAVPSAA